MGLGIFKVGGGGDGWVSGSGGEDGRFRVEMGGFRDQGVETVGLGWRWVGFGIKGWRQVGLGVEMGGFRYI